MPSEETSERKTKKTGNGTRSTMRDKLERVKNLAALALDDSESEESRTAAVQAWREVKESRLILMPEDELERLKTVVEGAAKLAKEQKDAKMNNMLMGAIGGFLLAKQKLL